MPVAQPESWTPVLGVAEDDLAPVRLDLLGDDPSLLVFGDRSSGKTSVLHTLLTQLVESHDDSELVVTVVDPRRRLLKAVPDDYLGAYAPNATAAAGSAQSLATELRARQPATTDPAELARHTWHGPRIVCVVHDAALVLGLAAAPFAPLLEFLPAGPDLGFHLLLARHAGGAGRALFEPNPAAGQGAGRPGTAPVRRLRGGPAMAGGGDSSVAAGPGTVGASWSQSTSGPRRAGGLTTRRPGRRRRSPQSAGRHRRPMPAAPVPSCASGQYMSLSGRHNDMFWPLAAVAHCAWVADQCRSARLADDRQGAGPTQMPWSPRSACAGVVGVTRARLACTIDVRLTPVREKPDRRARASLVSPVHVSPRRGSDVRSHLRYAARCDLSAASRASTSTVP